VRSDKFVSSNVLDATSVSFYVTLDRIIRSLNYSGASLYIPPYPKDTYLPEHLSALKEMIVFISSKDSLVIPGLEQQAKQQFMVTDPEGLYITPPGSGLVNLFEKELKMNLTKIELDDFYEILPIIVVNDLGLASDFEITPSNDAIHVKVIDSIYSKLYSQNENLKSVSLVGCPLLSAVACALAITSRKFVTVAQVKVTPDCKTIEMWFNIGERLR
jgi:hypothetical protein